MAKTNQWSPRQNSTRPDSIEDALEVLDSALEQESVATPQGRVTDTALGNERSVFEESLSATGVKTNTQAYNFTGTLQELSATVTQGVSESLAGLGPQFFDLSTEVVSTVSDYAARTARQGLEQSRVIAGEVDSRVRANPWPVIAGVTIGAFALGYLMAQRRGD